MEAVSGGRRGEPAACENQECVGAVGGIVVPGRVPPDAAVVVPFLAVGAQTREVSS
jgi:hypothetical protein